MKVIVADKIAKEGIQKLKAAGFEVLEAWEAPKEQLPELIKDCDAIIVRSATKVTKALIDAAPKLKVIGRAGVGLDNVDADHAKAKGIKVVNTPEATSRSVAELAIGHMIAAARGIGYGTATMASGKWEKKALEGVELGGKTLGLIGIGRIGKETAKLAVAMGMNVIAYDPLVKDPGVPGVTLVPSLDDLLSKSDFISIHVPLLPDTKNMIGKAELAKCKDGVILVNCARGGIVDEDALYDALRSGKVRAAGFDVFKEEPPTGIHKLATLPNVSLTPHIGAQTHEGQQRAGVQIAERVIEALKS
ncbi:MAG: hydroxyacid dehydrogenase [Thermoplasmata archaeon]|nr:hydroxyacid dehydrogenase [Thermoplasmata archaeon]